MAAQSPWELERPSLLGLQVSRFSRASSGPLEGIVALLESTFESQGDIYSEEPTSRGSGSTRRSFENPCPSLFREINILKALFTCLIYHLLEGSNELSTHGQLRFFGCLTIDYWKKDNSELSYNRLRVIHIFWVN